MHRLIIGLFAICFFLGCPPNREMAEMDDRDLNAMARESTGNIFWYCFESSETFYTDVTAHVSVDNGTSWATINLDYNGQAYCASSGYYSRGMIASFWVDTSDELNSVEVMEIRYCPADTYQVSTCSKALIVEEVSRTDGIFKRNIIFIEGYGEDPLIARSVDKTGLRLPGDETRVTSDDEPVTEPAAGTTK